MSVIRLEEESVVKDVPKYVVRVHRYVMREMTIALFCYNFFNVLQQSMA